MNLWSLVIYALLVVGLAAVIPALSYLIGQRHCDRATGEPFESGVLTTGSARIRFSAKFYLIAMFFVIFDLEAVFIFAWAVAVPELGWAGYIEILVFIVVLVVALIYLWRLGALDWGSSGKHLLEGRKERRSRALVG